jgi:PAS domain S-box-containing protein
MDNCSRLALVAKQTTNLVIITDAQRRITWVNDSFQHVTGYSLPEVLGQRPGTLLQFEGTDPLTIEQMRQALDEARPFHGEVLNRAKNGRMYWLEVDIQPMTDAQGQLTGFMAIESDITQHKLTAQELAASQSLLDQTGRIGGVGGWRFDFRAQQVHWTDQTSRILDLEPGHQPTLDQCLGFCTPDAQALLRQLKGAPQESSCGWDVEAPLVTASGRDIWVRLVAEPEFQGANVVGLTGAIHDITARRAMKAEINRNAQLLRGAIDTVDEAFALFDPHDRLVFCNEKYRQVHAGLDDLLQPGTSFEEILRATTALGRIKAAVGQEAEWIESRLALHRSGNATLTVPRDNGAILRVLERRMSDGHLVSFLIDITDLVNAMEEAQRANRAQAEFIATISHELRTPLQAILGFSDLGMHFAHEQPPFDQMFTDIHDGGVRMLRLVNDLLDTAKLESRHTKLNLCTKDVVPLIDDLERELAPLLDEHQLSLRWSRPTHPVMATLDTFLFAQVLRNILANAIRFAPPGSDITIELGQEGSGQMLLTIRDQGPGIPPDELEAIFAPFIQSSRTRDGSGGTGLGLHICLKIMLAHGGRIAAANAPEGGALISVWLPTTML